MSKVYEYKGFKIQNSPYGSEPRWFILNQDMTQLLAKKYPEKTLKECKKFIDKLKRKDLEEELNDLGYDILDIPLSVLETALYHGYQIINNHFIAYTSKDKKWYVDYWF